MKFEKLEFSRRWFFLFSNSYAFLSLYFIMLTSTTLLVRCYSQTGLFLPFILKLTGSLWKNKLVAFEKFSRSLKKPNNFRLGRVELAESISLISWKHVASLSSKYLESQVMKIHSPPPPTDLVRKYRITKDQKIIMFYLECFIVQV